MTALPDYSNRWITADTIIATRMNDMGQGGGLFAKAQISPNMTVQVSAGRVYFGSLAVDYVGGNSPTVTAPSTNPRRDILTIDINGTLAWTIGTEAASPTSPVYPAEKFPICEIYCRVGMTSIKNTDDSVNGYILYDARSPYISVQTAGIASDALQMAHDTEVNIITGTYIKTKTIILQNGFAGSLIIKFDLRAPFGDVFGKLYKDGVAWGTEQTMASTTYETFTQTFTDLNLAPGTQIQLYTYSSTTTCYTQNLRIYFSTSHYRYNVSTP